MAERVNNRPYIREHDRAPITDRKPNSALRRIGKAMVRNVREFRRELEEPIFPASATLHLPKDLDYIRAAKLIKLGILATKGHVYSVGSGEATLVSLRDAQPTELTDDKDVGSTIELTPGTIKHIVGERTLATSERLDAFIQQAQIQEWFARTVTLSRDHLLITMTPDGTFPTSMDGIDAAWNSLELPVMQTELNPKNPNTVRIEIPHPRWS